MTVEIPKEQIVFSYQISLEKQQVSFAFCVSQERKKIKFQDTVVFFELWNMNHFLEIGVYICG